jgi:FkbM family methyltransferase
MSRAIEKLKHRLERILGIKIYGFSLPHGTDLLIDLRRRFNPASFTCLFDVGANIGQTALTFSSQFPDATIYSFEPVVSTFETLKANTCKLANIRVFNLAFGSSRTRLPMAIDADSRKSTFAVQRPADLSETPTREMINVMPLDDFAIEHQITKIDFLKIDTEGFDLEVLNGADRMIRSGNVDFIQVEAGFDPTTIHVGLEQFLRHLQERNFALFGIYEQQPFWTGQPWLRYVNAVFVRRVL